VRHLYFSSLSSKRLRLSSHKNIFFNEDMATKNVVVQALKKKSTESLSRISCGASVTSSQRVHTMKTRSMAKVAVLTAHGQTAPPLSKLQGLRTQQKAPSWMDEIQKLQLHTPVYEVEDYYSNNSSSPSP